jgi:beta-mannanase
VGQVPFELPRGVATHRHALQGSGSHDATFAWCPTAWGFKSGAAQDYYPGDGYVDWICTDGYNWAPGGPRDKWRSFSEIFQAFYTWAMPHGKPLLIAEYGCMEGAVGQKASWFTAAQNDLKTQLPGIRAVVYFDSFRTYDWRVHSSTSAFNAFRSMGLDAYFNP